jgi:FAD/FMN-containing dehydrogenase
MTHFSSWGRYPKAKQQAVWLRWRQQNIDFTELTATVLPYGLGRSYGDSCLNDGGNLLITQQLNHFIAFDKTAGVLRCEAGISLDEILHLIVPTGWFLPATPGTKFVTVGGAIANDVHGKNHHRYGTFGCHVLRFELLRSNGERLLCSATENKELFAATIGGLGLTGLIVWAELQLRPIYNAFLTTKSVRFKCLTGFFELSAQAAAKYEYTVAWFDCQAQGNKLGRGIFMCADHAPAQITAYPAVPKFKRRSVPFNFPAFILNRCSIKAFNQLYYRLHKKVTEKVVHYEPFFYPLDSILNWNRIYGKRGFMQYQCVVPFAHGQEAIKKILACIAASGSAGSFLAVLKTFGDIKSPGLLSFPREGVTLALDFAHEGDATLSLLNRLDNIVLDYQGAVYPGKDARMSAHAFQKFYPQWQTFTQYIDEKFSSSFWRRVTNFNSKEII